ncbi:MAG: murein hydrolase activator EnvC family protein [Alkaliphilus sp.]
MRRKKSIYIYFVILILLLSSFSAFGNNVDRLNDQIEENKEHTEDLTNQLSGVEKRQKSVIAQLKEIETQIEKAEEEIEKLKIEIADAEENIVITVNQLTEAENNIDKNSDALSSRLDVMYRNGNIGYLEVLLSSRNFTEMLSNIDMIKRIINSDVELLKFMKEQRNIIKEKKIQLEIKRSQLLSFKTDVEVNQDRLIVSRGNQDRLRKKLLNDEKELKALLDQHQKDAERLEKELTRLLSAGKYVGGEMQWPAPGFTRITSPFGYRIHPILRTRRMHSGIDIATPRGTTIVAATRGTVVFAGVFGGYGRTVIIDHGGGIMTLYAHNSRLLVKVGQKVMRGQRVALAGSTGMSTGPHLHFEVRKNAKVVDPIPWVKGN